MKNSESGPGIANMIFEWKLYYHWPVISDAYAYSNFADYTEPVIADEESHQVLPGSDIFSFATQTSKSQKNLQISGCSSCVNTLHRIVRQHHQSTFQRLWLHI